MIISGVGVGDAAQSSGPDQLANQHIPLDAAFVPTDPWTVTFVVQHRVVADLSADLIIAMGDIALGAAFCQISFSNGDGALDRVSTVAVNDGTGSTTAGPIAFPVNTDLTCEWIWTGVNLLLKIAGATAVAIPGATSANMSNILSMLMQKASDLDNLGIRSITITQP